MLIQITLTDEEKARVVAAKEREAGRMATGTWCRMVVMQAVKESEEREQINERR